MVGENVVVVTMLLPMGLCTEGKLSVGVGMGEDSLDLVGVMVAAGMEVDGSDGVGKRLVVSVVVVMSSIRPLSRLSGDGAADGNSNPSRLGNIVSPAHRLPMVPASVLVQSKLTTSSLSVPPPHEPRTHWLHAIPLTVTWQVGDTHVDGGFVGDSTDLTVQYSVTVLLLLSLLM